MKWNVFEEKFVYNDAQYEAVLILLCDIDLNYASFEARELVENLTQEEKNEIFKRFEKIIIDKRNKT